jgi:uncharacterized protein YceH (UPF0502 family)
VRDAKRAAREELPSEAEGKTANPLLALQQRVAELEAENADLRRQLAELQAA